MQRIAFIASNEHVPWGGGSEHCWIAAAERLARRGVEVSVSIFDWGPQSTHVGRLRAAGCRIFLRHRPSLFRRAGRNLFPGFEHSRHLKKVAAGANLVVVSQALHFDGLVWLEASRSNGYTYATIVQGAPETAWPYDEMIEKLAPAYESACAAFFVSQATLDLCRRQFVTPLANGRVIRNPFNVRYDARPPWPSANSDQLFLAFVSRLEIMGKGYDVLLQVLDLPRWRQRGVRLSLFGRGPNERALRRWVDALKLENISFRGFVDDVERIWAGHHALILPSRYEGMPLTVVEAMLCGRPCIVTNVGGVRELVRDGVNGFLVKAPTVELLDEAMNRAWENRHRLEEMGEAAAADARKFVSPDPTEDLVKQLCALADGAAPQ